MSVQRTESLRVQLQVRTFDQKNGRLPCQLGRSLAKCLKAFDEILTFCELAVDIDE